MKTILLNRERPYQPEKVWAGIKDYAKHFEILEQSGLDGGVIMDNFDTPKTHHLLEEGEEMHVGDKFAFGLRTLCKRCQGKTFSEQFRNDCEGCNKQGYTEKLITPQLEVKGVEKVRIEFDASHKIEHAEPEREIETYTHFFYEKGQYGRDSEGDVIVWVNKRRLTNKEVFNLAVKNGYDTVDQFFNHFNKNTKRQMITWI